MPTMTKRVNVRATVAVRNTNPPIYGTYKNIIMSTGDILKCLTKRSVVEEILPDGSLIRLNFKNYYTDNGAGLDAKGEIKIIKPKQPPVKKVAPTELEKHATDISFNDAHIGNAGIKDSAESETSITETSVTTDSAGIEPPAILVTEGVSEGESATETVVEDSATSSEGIYDDKKDTNEQHETPIAETPILTDDIGGKSNNNNMDDIKKDTNHQSKTSAIENASAEDIASKIATANKKKSTTSKKKK